MGWPIEPTAALGKFVNHQALNAEAQSDRHVQEFIRHSVLAL
jgi:hypothetical protein